MRKHLSLSLVLLGVTAMANAGNETAKTFLSVRPQGQTTSPEKFSLWADRAFVRDGGWNGELQAVVFGGRSTRSSKIGQYFGFNNSADMVVNNVTDAATAAFYTRDIFASYFGLGAGYSSTLSFRPQQRVVGGLFDWKQYLGWWDCEDPRFWLEVSFPVVNVKNDMRLTETGVTGGTAIVAGGPTSVMGALAGGTPISVLADIGTPLAPVIVTPTVGTPAFGLINGAQKKTGVADVEIKAGYDYIRDECCHLDGYIGLIAPTGNRPKGVYVFEPIVGNNHHFGIMTGGSYGCEFWTGCSNNALRWEFETNFRYLIRSKEVRSFDLRNRPGSRYSFLYATSAAAAAPISATASNLTLAINALTQQVYVKPHSQISMTNALVYDHCNFRVELGWNVWAKESESISAIDNTAFMTGIFAVADFTSFAGGAPNIANGLSNIGNINAGGTIDLGAVPAAALTIADIDFNSAASPAALTNTVYGALGYHMDDWCWPIFVGVGGSYEFSAFNTALSRWLVWGKFGISI